MSLVEKTLQDAIRDMAEVLPWINDPTKCFEMVDAKAAKDMVDRTWAREMVAVLIFHGDLLMFPSDSGTVSMQIFCSDTFYYACADGEEISLDEVPDYFRLWLEQPKWAATTWCALKRNMRPLDRWVEHMKSEGVWSNKLDQLPVRT